MNQEDFELFQEFLAFKKMKEQQTSNDADDPQGPKRTTKKKTKTKYTKRKDGRYATTISVGYDADGNVIKKYLTAKTIAELDEKVLNLKEQLKKGAAFSKQDMLFKKYREYWWETKQLSIKAVSTKKMYLNIFNYLTSIDFTMLREIRTEHLQDIINENKEHPRTCQKIKLCLNEIFKKAIAERIVYYNPCDTLVLPQYKAKERRPLTAEEDYLTNLEIFDDMEKAFIFLIKYCGLRKSEVLALVKDDFSLSHNRLIVSKALFNEGGVAMLKDTKSGNNRIVPIPINITNFIKYYLSNLTCNKLFTRKENKYMNDNDYRYFWNTIIKKIKNAAEANDMKIGDDLTAHIFRHNYACMLMNANVDMKERQYLLGHSTIGVTMDIYTHIEANKMQAPKLLDEYLMINAIE